MKSKMLLSLILASLFASSSFGQDIAPLLSHKEKFTTNGKVFQDSLYGFPTYHEDGSVNGVAYRIYFLDGSGTFEGIKGNGIEPKIIAGRSLDDLEKNWMVSCREDAVDILTCLMVFPGISILVNTKGQEFVGVHGDGDPRGATVGIRFDNGSNFVGGKDSRFEGETAKKIIQLLKTADRITTNASRLKTRTDITKTVDIYGFNEAFSYINWVLAKCKGVYNARKGVWPDGGGFQTCVQSKSRQ